MRSKVSKLQNLVGAEEGTSSLLNKVMEATENLNDRFIGGRGVHGTVYKATLGPDGVYAVKKLTFIGIKGGSRSMMREIQTTGKVRHRNLIKMEEFWFRKNYGLILYRYMKNGSLHDVLHERNPPQPFEWNIRYKIALGTAQGLYIRFWHCQTSRLLWSVSLIHHSAWNYWLYCSRKCIYNNEERGGRCVQLWCCLVGVDNQKEGIGSINPWGTRHRELGSHG